MGKFKEQKPGNVYVEPHLYPMKFKSRKDSFFRAVIFGLNAVLVGIIILILMNEETAKHAYWVLLPIAAVVGLLFWLFFGTHYELTQENGLVYQSGPIHGKIGLDRITEIIKGKTLWVGLRPATARKGLIVKYDKFNEIYISPDTNESFIEKILELKGHIKITE